jgi:hypothetical protein
LQLIVIASIHQPSTATFQLFDKLLLLSAGKSHYFGTVPDVGAHFESCGFSMPIQMNPAEFILELMNTDFANDQALAEQRLQHIQETWSQSPPANDMRKEILEISASFKDEGSLDPPKESRANFFAVVLALVHRSFIKSYRDVVAYGIRIAMYTGLAIMMGTVWLRLKTDQADIQPVINSIVSVIDHDLLMIFVDKSSSSDPLSCHLWLLLMSPPSLKTGPHSSKNVQTVYTVQQHL